MAGEFVSNLISYVPSLISGFGAIASTRASQNIANQNLAYQKEYNQQVFDRADNAVTRAALDMERAGLSKTLAAGSPAQVGGTSVVPQKTDTSQIAMQNALNVANTLADIKMKKAQINNVNAQTNYQNVVTSNYEKQFETNIAKTESEIQLNKSAESLRQIELKYSDKIYFEQVQNLCADVLDKAKNRQLTEKDIQLRAEQIANTIQERQNLTAQERNIVAEYSYKELEYAIKYNDYIKFSNYDLPSTGAGSKFGKAYFDLSQMVPKSLSNLFKKKSNNISFSNSNFTNATDLIF